MRVLCVIGRAPHIPVAEHGDLCAGLRVIIVDRVASQKGQQFLCGHLYLGVCRE